MSKNYSLSAALGTACSAVVGALAVALLAGCETTPSTHAAFPLATPARFDQALPRGSVLGQPYLRTADVLPQAVTKVAAPLPPAVALSPTSVAQLLQQALEQRTPAVVLAHAAHPVLDSGWAGQVAMYTPR